MIVLRSHVAMCDRQRPPRVELLICFVVSSVICAFLIRRGHFTEGNSRGPAPTGPHHS